MSNDAPKRESVAAAIAVAIAGVPREDYWGLIKAIDKELKRFAIEPMRVPRG